ncbi:uncharacterized protein B0H18DRAFT_820128, partial [Fomitopsis serialis]|uniref:uncharacterized protein n=1 Tax=Fomitopsis serialis TaxID=139415 RepID=UPI0020084C1C
YVSKILVPYFARQKEKLGLPEEQECILQLDAWSVHRGQEFATWTEKMFAWVLHEYVPGGCTALFQPCDAGMQRPIKHTIWQAQHEDVVSEALARINHNITLKSKGQPKEPLKLDVTVGVLRNRRLGWLVKAY